MIVEQLLASPSSSNYPLCHPPPTLSVAADAVGAAPHTVVVAGRALVDVPTAWRVQLSLRTDQ